MILRPPLLMTRWKAERAKFRDTVSRRVVNGCSLFIITVTIIDPYVQSTYGGEYSNHLNQPNLPENEM